MTDEKAHFDWIGKQKYFFLLSAFVLGIGFFSIFKWHFNLGVEFSGGVSIEYRFGTDAASEDIAQKLSEKELNIASINKSGDRTYIIRTGELDDSKKEIFLKTLQDIGQSGSNLISYEQVGPSVSGELIRKTVYAILLSTFAILFWIAYQFKNIRFGIAASLATFHDAAVVLGIFTFFGHFFKAEIDYLFVTAVLTILSFSVHDTIVVFDRIREIKRKHGGTITDIANRAISETLRRSFFNSFVIILMLVALIVLGGGSIRWFATALLVGTISGTYSSPFIAVPLLVLLTKKK